MTIDNWPELSGVSFKDTGLVPVDTATAARHAGGREVMSTRHRTSRLRRRGQPRADSHRARCSAACRGQACVRAAAWSGVVNGMKLETAGLACVRPRRRVRSSRRVGAGRTRLGKRITRKASGKIKIEAKARLREILREHEDGVTHSVQRYSVEDAVRYWLTSGLGASIRAQCGITPTSRNGT